MSAYPIMWTPRIGSKISFISKMSEIRYEGILVSVDQREFTIALAQVRLIGTEDRVTEHPVPPRSEVIEHIIFKGSDIKDITVCETIQPVASLSSGLPYDPAIVSLSKQPNSRDPAASVSGASSSPETISQHLATPRLILSTEQETSEIVAAINQIASNVAEIKTKLQELELNAVQSDNRVNENFSRMREELKKLDCRIEIQKVRPEQVTAGRFTVSPHESSQGDSESSTRDGDSPTQDVESSTQGAGTSNQGDGTSNQGAGTSNQGAGTSTVPKYYPGFL